MKTVLRRLRGVKPVTRRDARPLNAVLSIRATERKSITSGSTAPEVWIMSGLLLSVVMQIVYASRRGHND